MSLGANIHHMRQEMSLTQEQLAERMGVSRQTVSRWEADAVVPELEKLVALCDVFACRLDALVREDLRDREKVYSPVETRQVPAFRMARYVMITPNPEDDVNAYMDRWARQAGLPADAKRIGWDFPHVSPEQQSRFGLRGYVAAYVLPEGFAETAPGVEYGGQREAQYAVITVRDPFAAPFERIPADHGASAGHGLPRARLRGRAGVLRICIREGRRDDDGYLHPHRQRDAGGRVHGFQRVRRFSTDCASCVEKGSSRRRGLFFFPRRACHRRQGHV